MPISVLLTNVSSALGIYRQWVNSCLMIKWDMMLTAFTILLKQNIKMTNCRQNNILLQIHYLLSKVYKLSLSKNSNLGEIEKCRRYFKEHLTLKELLWSPTSWELSKTCVLHYRYLWKTFTNKQEAFTELFTVKLNCISWWDNCSVAWIAEQK